MHLRQKAHAFIFMLICEVKRLMFGKKYFAEVDITDNCNLRCKHCYHFRNPFKELNRKEVPLSSWKKRFNDIHKKGVRFILLVGGEPTLRQDIIEFAYHKFPVVYIISNGIIKIPKKLGRLVIFLSVDGAKEKNDAIRGKGTFKKVLSNYSGDRRVILNMTLMKNNYTDLETVVKISKKHNFRGVVCNFYTTSPNYPDPLFIKNKDRTLIIKEIKRVKNLYPIDLLLTRSMID
jgi:MoaA/NifB/PqqE/SkfB family radical SAM enzyme